MLSTNNKQNILLRKRNKFYYGNDPAHDKFRMGHTDVCAFALYVFLDFWDRFKFKYEEFIVIILYKIKYVMY